MRFSSSRVNTIFCVGSSSFASFSAIFFASSKEMNFDTLTEAMPETSWNLRSSSNDMRATSSVGSPVLFAAVRIQSARPRETWNSSAIFATSAFSVSSEWKTSVPTASVCSKAFRISAEREAFSSAFASRRESKEIRTVASPFSIYPQAS